MNFAPATVCHSCFAWTLFPQQAASFGDGGHFVPACRGYFHGASLALVPAFNVLLQRILTSVANFLVLLDEHINNYHSAVSKFDYDLINM